MHYFAYGTLLVEDAMRSVCPSARNVGFMRLEGFELSFGKCSMDGVAGCTLLPKEGAVTYGIQYELTDEDMAKMDGAAHVEEAQWVHVPVTLVDAEGRSVPSSTYFIPGEFRPWAPTDAYVAPILKGLNECDFPEEYKTRAREIIATAQKNH
ncbi:gamma-glutamylcyclotransferase family protein [Aerobium aerolatum]|uniref:Gamma-glutamyl cyclotransferase, AIG2-like n=1 Tax=Aquamicrobium aerolatum DSM 21857 TaxID=1121003 RepID=A0A1I3I677_9HYPH|nr:gamma-glutamylcyclotransferase family protein [Aquamicrobium aerolatum]SFI43253.1 Gamma-glutamyl cyclotransferase, AIG2-like [Aquamicrobium aerolatum DSM 21857]